MSNVTELFPGRNIKAEALHVGIIDAINDYCETGDVSLAEVIGILNIVLMDCYADYRADIAEDE